jgi:hypothetical protein
MTHATQAGEPILMTWSHNPHPRKMFWLQEYSYNAQVHRPVEKLRRRVQ